MTSPYVFDQSTRISLSRALQLLEVFRALDETMPIGMAVSFLMIAAAETDEGSLGVTELKDRSGFALSSASRYVQGLSDLDRRKDLGLEIVSKSMNPMNQRERILRTTPKGRRIVSQLKQAIGG